MLFKPVDATLGVPGRPQSATGQTALYTGRNAPEFLGRHLTGFANGSLRILIEESGLFKQVLALGGRPTAANLYTQEYFQAIKNRRIRYSVGALLNLTSGVPFRMPEDYARGEALFWDITNRYSGSRGFPLPLITPQEAGRRLAHLAARYDVTLFECYLPDYAGHAQDMSRALEVLREIDGLIEGIILNKSPETSLVICSDHGNIENLSLKMHTLNPVPLLVFGPAAPAFAAVETIMGLTPVIVEQIRLGLVQPGLEKPA
jgi:2,3-bisphosphoglycerate-independent phosphoglycerate mutase